MRSRWASAAAIYVIAALALTALSVALNRWVAAPTGLVRSVYPEVDLQGEPLSQDTVAEISLDFLEERPELPRYFFSVAWRGFWFLPRDQTVEVYAGGDDEVVVWVDGELVLSRNATEGMHAIARTLRLEAGPHGVRRGLRAARWDVLAGRALGLRQGRAPGRSAPSSCSPSARTPRTSCSQPEPTG